MQAFKYSVFGEFLEIAKSGHRKYKWHKRYPNSDTIPMNNFDFNKVFVDKWSYGELNVVDFGGECRLFIGKYVSIAQHVTFLLNAEHHIDHFSTYPFKVKMLHTDFHESFGKGDIVIDDDVWIGYGATILSGVHVGQGAVIAAGSILTKNVPPYAVVGGNPAHIIKYRFKDDVIQTLLKIDFSSINDCDVKVNIEQLYKEVIEREDLNSISDLINGHLES